MSENAHRSEAAELLLEERRERIDRIVERRTRHLTVVLEHIEDPHNTSAIFRTCEAFGVQEVHLVDRKPSIQANPKISQRSEKWLDLVYHSSTEACFESLKVRGFAVLASAATEDARSIHELSFVRSTALVFGNEKEGASPEALRLADGRFWIPMRGFSESLNVSVAVAASIAVATDRRMAAGVSGALPEAEAAALRERFYKLAVKQRDRMFSKDELE